MKCNCPNCGREIEVTAQEARRLGGHLVCPQCLTRVDVAVAAAGSGVVSSGKSAPAIQPSAGYCTNCGSRVKASDDFCPKCGHSLRGGKRRTADAPPPYRRQTQRKSVVPAQAAARPARQPSSPSRPQRSVKSAKKALPIGPLGCFWRTIAAVAVGFAVYVLAGLLLQ